MKQEYYEVHNRQKDSRVWCLSSLPIDPSLRFPVSWG